MAVTETIPGPMGPVEVDARGWPKGTATWAEREPAIDKAITASNRAGRFIGAREARMIKALLRGWRE